MNNSSTAPQKDAHLPRKLFHILSGSIIPVLYYFEPLPREWTFHGVGIAFVIWIIFEVSRLKNESINQLFMRFFSGFMKTKEMDKYTGVSFMLGGALLSMMLFEAELAAITLFFIAIGDPVAAVIGKKFGHIRYKNGRSFEGSVAMFTVCFLVALSLSDYPIPVMIAGSFVAAVAEAFSGAIDDNLTVPLLSGVAITALG